MKYILLLLLFCTNVFAGVTLTPVRPPKVSAEDYMSIKASGLDIYLALKETGNCSEPKKFMYAVWQDTNVFYGCWVKINGQAHVMYDTGEAQIYRVNQ